MKRVLERRARGGIKMWDQGHNKHPSSTPSLRLKIYKIYQLADLLQRKEVRKKRRGLISRTEEKDTMNQLLLFKRWLRKQRDCHLREALIGSNIMTHQIVTRIITFYKSLTYLNWKLITRYNTRIQLNRYQKGTYLSRKRIKV